MPYTKQTWNDEVPSTDKYKITPAVGGAIENATIAPVTPPTTAGSPLNATRMNYIETGIEGARATADAAIPKSLTTAKGDLITASGASTPTRLAIGTAGYTLKSVSGLPAWALDGSIAAAAAAATADGKAVTADGKAVAAQNTANAAIPKSLTTTTGDLIYASAANTPARRAIGTAGYILKVVSGLPTWSVDGSIAAQATADAAIPKSLTTTTGDLIYASAANTPARRAIGTSGQHLTVSGGVPVWATPGAPAMVGIKRRFLYTVSGHSLTNANSVESTALTDGTWTTIFNQLSASAGNGYVDIPSSLNGKLLCIQYRVATSSTGTSYARLLPRINGGHHYHNAVDIYPSAGGSKSTFLIIYDVLATNDRLTFKIENYSGATMLISSADIVVTSVV